MNTQRKVYLKQQTIGHKEQEIDTQTKMKPQFTPIFLLEARRLG